MAKNCWEKGNYLFIFVVEDLIVLYRVSVERARGTPRGCDQWRGSGGGRGYGPPRGRSRDK
jgi:hypothetical protein